MRIRECLSNTLFNPPRLIELRDGNGVETQVDNFDTAEECMAFMESTSFAENPIGVDYDPDEFVKRVRSGEDEEEIKKRPDIGKRMTRLDKGTKESTKS